MSRSDLIPIDSRSHLEVADSKHRYAKNLRTYFKEYHRINGLSEIVDRSQSSLGNNSPSMKWSRYAPFFDWLDRSEILPNLAECPRMLLEEDRVEYLTTEAQRSEYEISINPNLTVCASTVPSSSGAGGANTVGASLPENTSIITQRAGVSSHVKSFSVESPSSVPSISSPTNLPSDPAANPATIPAGTLSPGALWLSTLTNEPVNTGPKGFIFVLQNGRMYGCEKRTSIFPRFHHSSFFAGSSVSAAGMVVCVQGRLSKLFPHSGHYRPHDRHLFSLLGYLRDKGVGLAGVQVDVQRVMKLSRQQEKDGTKAKKTECALYLDGETAYYFLKAKTSFVECGLLRHINTHRIEYDEGDFLPTVRERVVPCVSSSSGAGVSISSSSQFSSVNIVNYTAANGSSILKTSSSSSAAFLTYSTMSPTRPLPPSLQSASNEDTPPSTVPQAGPTRVSLSYSGPPINCSHNNSNPSNRSSLNRLSMNSTCTASSLGSVGSPFLSPVAHYQYPLHAASSDSFNAVTAAATNNSTTPSEEEDVDKGVFGGDSGKITPGYSGKFTAANDSFGSDSDKLGTESGVFTATDNVSFQPTNLCNAEHHRPLSESSADTRARVLHKLLYAAADTAQDSDCTIAIDRTSTANKEIPTSPPLPPSRQNNSSGKSYYSNINNSDSSGGLSIQTNIATTTTCQLSTTNNPNSYSAAVASGSIRIPAAAPIKKVTSYTSISSSYGSSSFIQHYTRSRSASKSDNDLERDLRNLLADSPIVVHAAEANSTHYNNYASFSSYFAATASNSSSTQVEYCTSPLHSACSSRGRSRGSSFNPPPLTASNIATNLAAANATFTTAEPGPLFKLNTLNSISQNMHNSSMYSIGTASIHSDGSEKRSPHPSPGDKSSPRAAGAGGATAAAAGSGARVPAGSPSGRSVNYQGGGSGGGVGGVGIGSLHDRIDSFSPRVPASAPVSECEPDSAVQVCGGASEFDADLSNVSDDVPIASDDNGIRESMFSTMYNTQDAPRCTSDCPPSPVPSFASSLSSTDSIPNMLNAVMSPGGQRMYEYVDGLYEISSGDNLHDHFFGGGEGARGSEGNNAHNS